MHTKTLLATLATAGLLAGSVATSASADVLLDTHFDGTGSDVSGGTLSGFDYITENGLAGGSMTADSNLFDLNKNASDSHFAVDAQVNSAEWVGDLAFTVTAASVTVGTVTVDVQYLNNAAQLNNVTRDFPIIASLIGSSSGSVATDTWNAADAGFKLETIASFDMGNVVLTNAETWTLSLQVNDLTTADSGAAGGGVYVSFDQITIEGAVPEPGSLALIGIGGLLIARRRRA